MASKATVGVILGDPETNLKTIEFGVDAMILLREILTKLERGADFQLGPAGKDRELPGRIRAALAIMGAK